jgi:hypothetical protein
MQVRERQKEQKKTIEKCNSERRNNEKWRKTAKTMQIRRETSWTNMILEKVAKPRQKADKCKQKAKQMQTKCKKDANQTRDQLDKHDFGSKMQKPR